MQERKERVTGLTQHELSAIVSLLAFYERHLWNFAAPSPKRTRQLTEIAFLSVKIPLLASTNVTAFTASEVAHIEEAIRRFSKQAREKIPPSASRDEVLASCEELRAYLVQSLTSAK
jgi:hypothetical protein